MNKKTEDRNWVAYTDRKGNLWSKQNLEELIRGYAHFKKFKDICDHYKGRFD